MKNRGENVRYMFTRMFRVHEDFVFYVTSECQTFSLNRLPDNLAP